MTATAQQQARVKLLDRLEAEAGGASPAAVRETVERHLAELESVLDGLDSTTAIRAPSAQEWSVADVVDHLLQTVREGLDELRSLVAGERPPPPPIPGSLRSRSPRHRPWSWLLRELRSTHRDIVGAMTGGSRRPGEPTAPTVLIVGVRDGEGGWTPYEWVEDLDWRAYALVIGLHAREHRRQVGEILAALGGSP